MYSHAACVYIARSVLVGHSCLSRFAQKDFKITFATVSYTHLDVYKRQDKGFLVFVDFIRLEVKGEFKVVIYVVFQLEPCCNFSHARLFLPVSYTHLDVYKRQAIV